MSVAAITDWLTVGEAAEIARVSTRYIRTACEHGSIAAERDGKSYRLRRTALADWSRTRRPRGRPKKPTLAELTAGATMYEEWEAIVGQHAPGRRLEALDEAAPTKTGAQLDHMARREIELDMTTGVALVAEPVRLAEAPKGDGPNALTAAQAAGLDPETARARAAYIAESNATLDGMRNIF